MRSARGFTIVETIVTIGILLVLAGLLVAVANSVTQQSKRRQTETTMMLLDQALNEWQVQADRTLTWWQGPPDDETSRARFDIHSDTAEVLIISEMLQIIRRVATVDQILQQIDDQFLHTYEAGVYPKWLEGPAREEMDDRFDGALTVLDSWGTPIYATHPGRAHLPTDPDELPRDLDGTIQTYNELRFGICRNRRACFVSAGPDKLYGYMNLPNDEVKDNLYTTEVDAPVNVQYAPSAHP